MRGGIGILEIPALPPDELEALHELQVLGCRPGLVGGGVPDDWYARHVTQLSRLEEKRLTACSKAFNPYVTVRGEVTLLMFPRFAAVDLKTA